MKHVNKMNPYEILAILSLFLGLGTAGASDFQEISLQRVIIQIAISLVGFCVFGTLSRVYKKEK